MSQSIGKKRRDLDQKRDNLLKAIEERLELPMVILGLVWLALLVWDFTLSLPSYAQHASTVIWVVFIFDFVLRWALACRKVKYLKRHWITAVALVVPALRIFQVLRIAPMLRVARATNSIRLVRVLTSLNRGIRVLGIAMGERGFGYVIAMTLTVTFAGAAAMYAFERDVSEGAVSSYGSALWWTAMLMTTMGSQYWPQSTEGRILCLLLSVYAFAIFGYVTAAIASILVGKENRDTRPAADAYMKDVHAELLHLREQLERIERKA